MLCRDPCHAVVRVPLPRLIGKLQTSADNMDNIGVEINDVYAAGAVEGYNSQTLGYIIPIVFLDPFVLFGYSVVDLEL